MQTNRSLALPLRRDDAIDEKEMHTLYSDPASGVTVAVPKRVVAASPWLATLDASSSRGVLRSMKDLLFGELAQRAAKRALRKALKRGLLESLSKEHGGEGLAFDSQNMVFENDPAVPGRRRLQTAPLESLNNLLKKIIVTIPDIGEDMNDMQMFTGGRLRYVRLGENADDDVISDDPGNFRFFPRNDWAEPSRCFNINIGRITVTHEYVNGNTTGDDGHFVTFEVSEISLTCKMSFAVDAFLDLGFWDISDGRR